MEWHKKKLYAAAVCKIEQSCKKQRKKSTKHESLIWGDGTGNGKERTAARDRVEVKGWQEP